MALLCFSSALFLEAFDRSSVLNMPYGGGGSDGGGVSLGRGKVDGVECNGQDVD